jgi:aarF domain-containing kinase
MTFKEGFVHSDPHPGNLFVRKNKHGECELIILDHGIYTEMDDKTRLSYTKLWRGILAQDEDMIKRASGELGSNLHQLLTSLVSSRNFSDVMDETKSQEIEERLGKNTDPQAKEKA